MIHAGYWERHMRATQVARFQTSQEWDFNLTGEPFREIGGDGSESSLNRWWHIGLCCCAGIGPRNLVLGD